MSRLYIISGNISRSIQRHRKDFDQFNSCRLTGTLLNGQPFSIVAYAGRYRLKASIKEGDEIIWDECRMDTSLTIRTTGR